MAVAAAYLLGVVFSAQAFLYLESRFNGIWLPIALGALVYLWLGLTPIKQGVRVPYALMLTGGAVAAWIVSSDLSLAGRFEKLAAPVCALVAAAGAVWWIAACAAAKTKPPYGWMAPLCLCAWLVAYFSSAVGGASHMVEFVMRHFSLSEEGARQAVFIMRKTVHYSFYGTVGFLALMTGLRANAKSAIAFGLLVALTYCSFDEYRQSFFPGRTASVYDVMLDMTGAGSVIGIATLVGKAKAKPVPR